MKITLEQAPLAEPEVYIRGELGSPQVTALIAALQRAGGAGKMFLCREEKEYPVDPSDISFFEARASKVYARTGGEDYEAGHKLYELCDWMRARGFVQISKSVVVNVNHIRSVEAEFSGNYTALLKDGRTRLTISRKYMKDFRKYVMEEK
ncbi:MAG: LytTR family DNA-binding domain-containing protein [Candidatus Pelethousia sp.]|nr:LytTR family DNA-binding domain-containing protein [Candidatus Pelethousia sp.]